MLNFNIWYVKVDVIHPNLHLWIQQSENGWSAWWGGKMIIPQESYSTTHPSNTSQVCTHTIQLWKEFFGLQPVGKGCLGCVPVRCVETTLGRIHHHFHDRTLGQQASPQAVARHHVDPKETTPKRDVFCWCTNSPNKEWDKEYTPAENEKTSPTDFGKVRKIIYSKSAGWDGDMCRGIPTLNDHRSIHQTYFDSSSTADIYLLLANEHLNGTICRCRLGTWQIVVRIITPLPCWWHSDFERPKTWYRNYAPRE